MEQVLRSRLTSQRPHEVLYSFDLLTTRFDVSVSELSMFDHESLRSAGNSAVRPR